MELFKSLKDKIKSYETPFKHFELNEPLTDEAIKEICETDITDPKTEKLSYQRKRLLRKPKIILQTNKKCTKFL